MDEGTLKLEVSMCLLRYMRSGNYKGRKGARELIGHLREDFPEVDQEALDRAIGHALDRMRRNGS